MGLWYAEFECLQALGISCEVTTEKTGKPAVIPTSKPGETRELFCSETAERGEATSEVRIDRAGMRTVEEGFRVSEADLVPEWWEAGISSRLLCASFCGWPPETSGSYRGGKLVTLKTRLGFMTGTVQSPRGNLPSRIKA